MLEKNLLYRRMQHRDIFRTFSRTYSRQHHQRTQRTNPHNFTAEPLQNTSNQNSSSFRIIEEGRVFTANDSIRRQPSKGLTTPIHVKTQQTNYKCVPFSQTLNLNTMNSKYSRCSSTKKDPYLGSTFGKRKESDSLLVNIHGRNKRENFRLKACMQRQNQQYDGHQDQTQFSLLELERKNALRKGWIGENKPISVVFKTQNNFNLKKMNPHVGKKVAAHVFSKYACIQSPQKIRNIRSSQLE